MREHGKALGCRNYYWCEDCEAWHLTSREPDNER